MGRLVYYELQKCLQQRFLRGLFLAIVLLNLLCVFMSSCCKNELGYSKADISKIYRQIKSGKAITDRDQEENPELFAAIQKQTDSMNSYGKYWENIMTGGSSIAVLLGNDEESYASRNQKKIREAYKKLKNAEIYIDNPEAFAAVTKQPVADFMILLWAYCCMLFLITDERQKGYYRLTEHAENGGKAYRLAKYLAILLYGITGTIVVYGTSFVLVGKTLGFGKLDRSIQSVYGCMQCPFKVTAGQYLVIFMLVKVCAVFAVTCVMFWIVMAGKNMLYTIAYTTIWIVVSFAIWKSVPVHSVTEIFHFLNIFDFLDTDSILTQYYNLDLFGWPVNRILITIVLAIICCFFGISGVIKNKEKTDSRFFERKVHRQKHQTGYAIKNIAGFEMYKLWVGGKGLFLILVCLGTGVLFAQKEVLFTDSRTAAYEYYCKQIEGDLSAEKEQYLKKEENRLENDTTDESSAAYDQQLEGLKKTVKQYEIIKQRLKEGKDVGMIDQTVWEKYFDEYTERINCVLAGVLSLMLICAGTKTCTMEVETGAEQLLNAVNRGKSRVYGAKYVNLSVYAILGSLCIYLPYFIREMRYYGKLYVNVNVNCLTIFENSMPDISIGIVLLLYWLCRLAGSVLVCVVVCACAEIFKKSTAVFGFSMLFLMLPVGLYMTGITGEWGILPLITGRLVLLFL